MNSSLLRISAKRLLNNSKSFNKVHLLASSSSSSMMNTNLSKNCFLLAQPQFRMVASDKKAANPGYLDGLVGEYEDPNYKLDIKTEEWREGQWFYFFSDFGVWILLVPTCIAIAASAASLMWYTLFDPTNQVLRFNPHPELAIKNGLDLYQVRSPLLAWQYEFGLHHDRKMHFYHEIEDAIERKKKLASL